jgi:hypothetical protein
MAEEDPEAVDIEPTDEGRSHYIPDDLIWNGPERIAIGLIVMLTSLLLTYLFLPLYL